MISRSHATSILFALAMLLSVTFSACKPETIEVTRVTILERRVIEHVLVTVEVTRIQRVIETPKPTSDDVIPPSLSTTVTPSATLPVATATPTSTPPAAAATVVPVSSARQTGDSILVAIKDTEGTFLSLVQALNSDPLPIENIIALYDTLRNAPAFSISEDEVELQSIHFRYREQVDNASGQGTDLYNHLVKIQAGEASQTEVSPIHVNLAEAAASAGTSTIQALIRELEDFLASLP